MVKALSIKQPWLDAILYSGKTTENRTWAPYSQYIGARLLLHSSADPDRTARSSHDAPRELTDNMLRWPFALGAVLGAATLVGCHLDDGSCCAPWGQRSGDKPVFHWQLADVVALPEPVPAKGSLQFWTPTPAVLDAVHRQIELPT